MTPEARPGKGPIPQRVELDLSKPVQLILKVPGAKSELTVDMSTREELEEVREEKYYPTKESARRAVANLSRTGRRYISSATQHEGTVWDPANMGTLSSEAAINTDSDKTSTEAAFRSAIDEAILNDVSQERIERELRRIGMTVRIAEATMGDTPGPVDEQIQRAKMIVRHEERRQRSPRSA